MRFRSRFIHTSIYLSSAEEEIKRERFFWRPPPRLMSGCRPVTQPDNLSRINKRIPTLCPGVRLVRPTRRQKEVKA